MTKRDIFTLLGFLLFFIGFLALILNLVSLQLSFLKFIDMPGKTFGLVVRIAMIFGGMALFYIARNDKRS
jgi:ABC-type antimicrobial peptide transport system permease subunit